MALHYMICLSAGLRYGTGVARFRIADMSNATYDSRPNEGEE